MTLRGRFVFTFVAFALLLTAAGGALSLFFTRSQIERELDEKLIAVAGTAAEVGGMLGLASPLAPGMEQSQSHEILAERLRVLQKYVADAYLIRRDLSVVVSTAPTDSLPIGAPLYFLQSHLDAVEQAWEQGQATSELFDVDGSLYKYGFVRLDNPDVADTLMIAAQIPANYQDALDRLRSTVLAGSIGSALFAILLAGLLATRVTRPLDRLSMAALRIQRGRMKEAIPVEGTDEIGRLSRAMERMRVGLLDQRKQMELMVAQVAHEIRNPLGGIELLSSAAADSEDPVERRRVIAKIRGEVTALNDIISDFLEFARPAPASKEAHDVRRPIQDATDIVQAEVAPRNGSIHLDLPAQPLSVLADPGHLKRLVLNLVRNGAQSGQNVWVEARRDRDNVVVSVKDDGPGIPEELREGLFQPFVTDKEQGAGLGLAIVKKLAEANGGQVEWDPEGAVPGGGAEFRVYFESVP